ncbi:acyl-CoA thioesterase [Marinomonas sp. PE14-40]|uniref:acyl-CoA thioesterase n=1 Tax=Marinomonas sp. PE14-40 TaxID=3060621 RepID=UPI003F6632EF
MPELHSINFEVRDYECDMQGIVNNSVYQNYIEHARHKFLLAHNVDFAEITKNGIHLVVMRAELDFKKPLISSDEFIVTTHAKRQSKFKFEFHQEIIRVSDKRVMLKAKVIAASITDKGKPVIFTGLDHALAE